MVRKHITDHKDELWGASTSSMPKSYCTEWEPDKKRFRCRIQHNGKLVSLGRYRTKGLAWLAYAKDSLGRYGKRSPFWRNVNTANQTGLMA